MSSQLTQNSQFAKTIALDLINVLSTPFDQTESFRAGIIDRNGNQLIPNGSLTQTQQQIYTPETRLYFKLRQLILRYPSNEWELRNILQYFLYLREAFENDDFNFNQTRLDYFESLIADGVVFAEEYCILEEISAAGPINSVSNVAGTNLENGGPVVKKKDISKYLGRNQQSSPIKGIVRRLQ